MTSYEEEWAEWDRKARSHYETPERGWTTIREEREKMKVSPSKSTLPEIPDDPAVTFTPEEVSEHIRVSTRKIPSQKHKRAVSDARRQAYTAKLLENAEKEEKNEEKRKQKELAAAARKGRRQGMTFKSKVKDTVNYTTDRAKSKLRKIKSEKPIEIVDEVLEAARKKGYDAHKKDQRAREIVKAEKQGRRDAMTFKSKVVEDTTNIAEKLEPVGKRVAKNVGKLMGEVKYTAKAAAKPHVKPARIATTKTTTTKPQAQRKPKPGPAVRKGTIGHRSGGLPVKSHKSGPGRRAGGLPVRSTKPGPGHKSNKGVLAARSGYKPGHKSNKPGPTNNIPKTATVNRQRSVNFAMRKRSRK